MFQADVLNITQRASTGDLPSRPRVAELMAQVHERYAGLTTGEVADYIPILAAADPAWFGLALVGVNGTTEVAGDAGIQFSIQSISKAFVFALVCEAIGHEAVHARVGVNNTGLAFNSVIAVELRHKPSKALHCRAGVGLSAGLKPDA